MKRLSRRGFIVGAGPLLAAFPLAKALGATGSGAAPPAPGPGEHAHVMEGHAPAMEPSDAHSGPHTAGAMTLEAVAGEGPDRLLHPPAPEPASEGRVREVELVATERRIEIASGVDFDAWTYNGTVPGPVIRATEGDLLRVRFTNRASHGHTVHFHGIHPTSMDGASNPVDPGETFVYELRARPAGTHVYHCHVMPLAEHIARGLYGAFIVDPKEPREPAQELVMVLGGFDLDGDGRNELYAVNGRPQLYAERPIRARPGRPVRIHLVNMTEYDPINSFHLHAAFFHLSRTGTTREPEYTDVVMLGQGERCMIELEFPENGVYMFHSHQSHMVERGWMGWFSVADSDEEAARQEASLSLGSYGGTFGNCDPCLATNGAKAILRY